MTRLRARVTAGSILFVLAAAALFVVLPERATQASYNPVTGLTSPQFAFGGGLVASSSASPAVYGSASIVSTSYPNGFKFQVQGYTDNTNCALTATLNLVSDGGAVATDSIVSTSITSATSTTITPTGTTQYEVQFFRGDAGSGCVTGNATISSAVILGQ